MSEKELITPSVLIVGAGPMGLSAAAFLRAAGAEVSIHGKTMESWTDLMPDRMILRSTRISSSIASPGDACSIDQFERLTGTRIDLQPTIGQFIAYGFWFQQQCVPDVNPTRIQSIQKTSDGFVSEMEDGSVLRTQAVVLATGINPFPYIPTVFAGLPVSLVSHVSGHSTFEPFRGKKVIVIGRGQSALESAAILKETGAQVEIVTRGSRLNFIAHREARGLRSRIVAMPGINAFLYPPTDLAGPPYNWAIADPVIYRRISAAEKAKTFELVGPIGSTNLESRLAGVPVKANVQVTKVTVSGDKVCLVLSDGSRQEADHVLLATGFRPDLNQVEILSDDLKSSIAQEDGYPLLTLGYESTSVRGLYFVGALSIRSQGPINRFVCGTYPMSQYLTEAITGQRIGYPDGKDRLFVRGRRMMYPLVKMALG